MFQRPQEKKVDVSSEQSVGLREVHHRYLPPGQSMSYLQVTLHEESTSEKA